LGTSGIRDDPGAASRGAKRPARRLAVKKAKKMITPKKLHLTKETVLRLRDEELHQVGGATGHCISVNIGCNT
jgi:hypothetical protein